MFPRAFEAIAVTLDGTRSDGWADDPEMLPGPPSIPVVAVGLHYGQIAFEGMRARVLEGRGAAFRPGLHWERLSRSMSRLAIPPIDRPRFDRTLAALLAAIDPRVADPAEFLYLRPLVVAMDPDWSMSGSETFRLVLMAGWTREAFDRAPRVVAFAEARRRRTWPGGTGDVKVPANYGPAFATQQRATEVGAHTVLWLDPAERWVEEFTSMNALVVDDDGVLHAPAPGSTVLDGVTRRSVLEIAREAGIGVSESPMRWPAPSERPADVTGTLLATGTAAGLAVVDEVRELSPEGELVRWTSERGESVATLQDLVRACYWGDARRDWWFTADRLGTSRGHG